VRDVFHQSLSCLVLVLVHHHHSHSVSLHCMVSSKNCVGLAPSPCTSFRHSVQSSPQLAMLTATNVALNSGDSIYPGSLVLHPPTAPLVVASGYRSQRGEGVPLQLHLDPYLQSSDTSYESHVQFYSSTTIDSIWFAREEMKENGVDMDMQLHCPRLLMIGTGRANLNAIAIRGGAGVISRCHPIILVESGEEEKRDDIVAMCEKYRYTSIWHHMVNERHFHPTGGNWILESWTATTICVATNFEDLRDRQFVAIILREVSAGRLKRYK
jgi:hypothetical protein